MDPSWQPVLSAAQRRKQRRLRSWWRHEQQSIAAALATFTHHSALRGQKTARAGEEESETKYTAKFRTNPPPQAAGTEYYELSDDDVVPAKGSRPPCLGEPRGPQELDQPRTVEQIAVYAPMVQILDAPVPQLVEQLPNLVEFFAALSPVPEQVIAVPKILPHDVPPRRWCRDTQLVEQLVEVPTIVSWSLLQRIPEQIDRQSSSAWWSWSFRRFSRLSPWTQFVKSDCEQDRWPSSSAQWCWASSRFSPTTEFNCDIFFVSGTHF